LDLKLDEVAERATQAKKDELAAAKALKKETKETITILERFASFNEESIDKALATANYFERVKDFIAAGGDIADIDPRVLETLTGRTALQMITEGVKGVEGAASGATVVKSGLALVGEKGPELANLQRGTQIISNAQSQQLLGGGRTVVEGDTTIQLHFHGDINSEIDFERKVGQAFKDLKQRGGLRGV